MKLPLIISEDENYNSKQNKLNVALKFSPKDNNINIIIFKCVLEVRYSFYDRVTNIVKLRRGSGKDWQGMALKAKDVKA